MSGPSASLLTSDDLYLYNEGTHYRLYDKLGAPLVTHEGRSGTLFAVWAPNAAEVSVVGDWNGGDRRSPPLTARDSSGIWEGFIPDVGQGQRYKYFIRSHHNGYRVEKAD